MEDSIDSIFKTTFQILGVDTAGLLFILASRYFVGTRADINHPEHSNMTIDFDLERESVLSFNARRYLHTAFILTSLFEPRYKLDVG